MFFKKDRGQDPVQYFMEHILLVVIEEKKGFYGQPPN